jgi:hypothetical protein
VERFEDNGCSQCYSQEVVGPAGHSARGGFRLERLERVEYGVLWRYLSITWAALVPNGEGGLAGCLARSASTTCSITAATADFPHREENRLDVLAPELSLEILRAYIMVELWSGRRQRGDGVQASGFRGTPPRRGNAENLPRSPFHNVSRCFIYSRYALEPYVN